jgi:uncharacterized protein (TIGR02246 family)
MRSQFFLAAILAASMAGPLAGCGRTDVGAEEAKIRDLDKKWVAAVGAKDATASANFYAVDGVIMPAGQPIAQGRSAIASVWKGLLGLKNFDLTFAPSEVTVGSAGDIAYEIGTYALSFDGDKGPVKDVGKYVVVWKKVEGNWQVAADIFNSDGPAK